MHIISAYRSQENVSVLPSHQTLDLTSPKDEEPNFEETIGEDEQQQEPSRHQDLHHELESEDMEEEREVEERGSGVGTDEESLPELFAPSSPLHIDKNFLLPDIMEESENEQSESLRSSLLSSDGTIVKSQSRHKFTKFNPFEETGLDVVETSFNDDVPLPINDNSDNVQDLNTSGSPVEPPILPVSPPPGPLLSPRYSMMLLDSNEQANDYNRFSVVSVSSEMAPPLPTSLPPGKLIPRESLYQDPESKIDLWYELRRTNVEKVHSGDPESQEELKYGAKYNPTHKTEDIDAEPSHKFTEHLTSDSGFPDTDMATDHSTGRNAENPVGSAHQFLSVSTKNSSTSITSYSDERTTEYSGSLGLKTNASSGSQVRNIIHVLVLELAVNFFPIFQHSQSEVELHENDDVNSMSTKFGDYAGQDEVEPYPPIVSPPFSPGQGENVKPSIRKTGYAQ